MGWDPFHSKRGKGGETLQEERTRSNVGQKISSNGLEKGMEGRASRPSKWIRYVSWIVSCTDWNYPICRAGRFGTWKMCSFSNVGHRIHIVLIAIILNAASKKPENTCRKLGVTAFSRRRGQAGRKREGRKESWPWNEMLSNFTCSFNLKQSVRL